MRGSEQCHKCGGPSSVIDTRSSPRRHLRRRRKCQHCGLRWSTQEVPVNMVKSMRQAERARAIAHESVNETVGGQSIQANIETVLLKLLSAQRGSRSKAEETLAKIRRAFAT